MFATKWIPSLANPIKGEALAIIWGLQISGETGFFELAIETDNLQIALSLQSHFSSLNVLGILLEDILSLFRSLVSTKFNHYFWEVNELVYHLVKLANLNNSLCI